MDMNLFKKIVDDLKKFPSKIKMLHLHGFGEPILNKNLPKMIALLKKENVVERIATTTNGTAFTNNNMKGIIQAGLDQIHISIYGLSQEQYIAFTNAKTDFSKLLENIKTLYTIKQDCHIHIKIVGDYFSKEENENFLNIFGDYCDSIFIDNAANIWPGLDISESVGNKIELKHQYSEIILPNKLCPQLFYQMLIHSDGSVSPCCADFAKEAKIGDVNIDSLKNIWEGHILQTMRLDHLNGQAAKYEACKKCQYPIIGSSVNLNPYIEQIRKLY